MILGVVGQGVSRLFSKFEAQRGVVFQVALPSHRRQGTGEVAHSPRAPAIPESTLGPTPHIPAKSHSPSP